MTGASVLSRVEEVYRREQELVPIPHHNSEESHVLGRARNQNRAMKIPAQVIFFYIYIFSFVKSKNCLKCILQHIILTSLILKIYFHCLTQ